MSTNSDNIYQKTVYNQIQNVHKYAINNNCPQIYFKST